MVKLKIEKTSPLPLLGYLYVINIFLGNVDKYGFICEQLQNLNKFYQFGEILHIAYLSLLTSVSHFFVKCVSYLNP